MLKATFQEMLEKQQLGIDCIEVANSFGEATAGDDYKIGMGLLKEVRDFMIEIKQLVGNFTVEEEV